MQQIVPFVLQVNANATLAVAYRVDFAIAQLIELVKVDNGSVIKCTDEVAFTHVSTKRNHTTSGRFPFKHSESSSIVHIL